jgi:hypothetical protein
VKCSAVKIKTPVGIGRKLQVDIRKLSSETLHWLLLHSGPVEVQLGLHEATPTRGVIGEADRGALIAASVQLEVPSPHTDALTCATFITHVLKIEALGEGSSVL